MGATRSVRSFPGWDGKRGRRIWWWHHVGRGSYSIPCQISPIHLFLPNTKTISMHLRFLSYKAYIAFPSSSYTPFVTAPLLTQTHTRESKQTTEPSQHSTTNLHPKRPTRDGESQSRNTHHLPSRTSQGPKPPSQKLQHPSSNISHPTSPPTIPSRPPIRSSHTRLSKTRATQSTVIPNVAADRPADKRRDISRPTMRSHPIRAAHHQSSISKSLGPRIRFRGQVGDRRRLETKATSQPVFT